MSLKWKLIPIILVSTVHLNYKHTLSTAELFQIVFSVGYIIKKPNHLWFQKAQELPTTPPLAMFLHEIFELVKGMKCLLYFRREDLKALHAKFLGKFIPHNFVERRVFGCLWPGHRKFTKLRYGFDQPQLLFVMCHTSTSLNYLGSAAQRFELMSEFNNNTYGMIPYKIGTLMKPKSGQNFAVCQTHFFIRPVAALDWQPMQPPSII